MNEISQKQLEANRENAKLGGVKTEEGKAISKYNALKHGLLTKVILLPNEDETALIELNKRLRGDLKPASELESILIDRIVANAWRLGRVMKIEKEMIEQDCEYENWNGVKQQRNIGAALSYDFANHDTYGKLIRYETSIERGIYKALHELQRIQSVRLGGKPVLPVAIDVDVAQEE